MATERVWLPIVLVLAVAAAGCTKNAACRSDTVLLTIALDAATAAADSLEIDVTIDGATKQSTVAHAAGSSSGTVEVRFPGGYPAGKSADVGVVALQAGSPLGAGTTSVPLTSGCTVAAVQVEGGAVIGDDLAGTVDMTLGPDVAGCPSSTENCFNGIDDNCDGLVDCADPQCTGGATPQAECVPDPGSATAGTLSATTCPTAYGTDTPIYASLMAGSCATGSCACFNGLSGTPSCSATLINKGTTVTACDTAFGGTTIFSNATNATGCISFAATLTSNSHYSLSYTTSGSCNVPSGGTASKVAPTWGSTNAFCSGGAVGGGCGSGQVCMPVAPSHCVLETGSQASCTVPGYSVQNQTQFFTGFDDSGRACSCTCTPAITCNAGFYTAGGCSGGPFTSPAGCYTGWGAYASASIAAPGGTCGAGAGESGATSTTGLERTVCCTN